MTLNRAKAHRLIATLLSPYTESVADLRVAMPKFSDEDWELLAKMAGQHMVSQAIFPALQQHSLDDVVPQDVIEYWHDLASNSAARNLALREQLVELITHLNSHGIQPILIKGSAHILLGTYQNLGDRLSNDLDILIANEDAQTGYEALQSIGYWPDDDKLEYESSHHHFPPLMRDDVFASLEVHRDLLELSLSCLIPTEDAIGSAESIDPENGLSAQVLSIEMRLMHSIVHIEITDRCFEAAQTELRQLHELALLVSSYGDRIDWGMLIRYADAHDFGVHLRANLYAARKFMGVNIPNTVFARHRIAVLCHYWRTRARYASKTFHFLDKTVWRRMHSERMVREYGGPRRPLNVNIARIKHVLYAPARLFKKSYSRCDN